MLQKLRLEKKWTQGELAKRSGVSVRTVGKAERQQGWIQYHIRRKMLKALGIPYERHKEIFGDGHRIHRVR